MVRQWRWTGSEGSAATGVATRMQQVVVSEAWLEKGMTLVRIVGEVRIEKVASSTGLVYYGWGLVFNDKDTVDPKQPLPTQDYDHDWLYLRTGFLGAHDTGGDYSPRVFNLDARAMRKVRTDDEALFIVGVAGVDCNLSYGIRAGFKLP